MKLLEEESNWPERLRKIVGGHKLWPGEQGALIREACRALVMDERAALAAVGWANSMGEHGALKAKVAALEAEVALLRQRACPRHGVEGKAGSNCFCGQAREL